MTIYNKDLKRDGRSQEVYGSGDEERSEEVGGCRKGPNKRKGRDGIFFIIIKCRWKRAYYTLYTIIINASALEFQACTAGVFCNWSLMMARGESYKSFGRQLNTTQRRPPQRDRRRCINFESVMLILCDCSACMCYIYICIPPSKKKNIENMNPLTTDAYSNLNYI